MSERAFFPIGDTMRAELSAATHNWRIKTETNQTLMITAGEDNTGPAYIKFGRDNVTANPANSLPLLRGSIQTFGIDSQTTHIAACMDVDGEGVIWLTPGQGE